jgi:hypothetical protein
MTTKVLKIFKETVLPALLVPDSIYYIAPAARPTLVEIYVTDTAGAARKVIDQTTIQAMISSAVNSATELSIVDNIAARNALNPTKATYCYVVNATGDSTVQSGGATYLYNPATSSWIKTSESESLDVVLDWANIQNKPSSTTAQIDSAVAAAHTHTNKTQLDKVGEDSNGNLTYSSSLPHIGWDTTNW